MMRQWIMEPSVEGRPLDPSLLDVIPRDAAPAPWTEGGVVLVTARKVTP